MTLKQIRTQLVEKTGRFDLVEDTTEYADNGANFVINAGMRMLDSHPLAPQYLTVQTKALAKDAYYVDVTRLRAVRRVRFKGGNETYYLTRTTVMDLYERLESDEDELSDSEPGKPVYYAIDQSAAAIASGAWTSRILLLPPADAAYTLYVEGLFYNTDLTLDADENFWTVMHPDILIQAAMWQLESEHRNRSGMLDHMAVIETKLQALDFGEVQEDVSGIPMMRNSW